VYVDCSKKGRSMEIGEGGTRDLSEHDGETGKGRRLALGWEED